MAVSTFSLARHCISLSIRFQVFIFRAFSHVPNFSCVRFTSELKACFESLNENPDCRSIVLSGAGKYFTAGLDLKDSLTWATKMAEFEDAARKGHWLEKRIKTYQVLMNRRFSMKSLPLGNWLCFITLFRSLSIRMQSLHWKFVQNR